MIYCIFVQEKRVLSYWFTEAVAVIDFNDLPFYHGSGDASVELLVQGGGGRMTRHFNKLSLLSI
jgi:hypothetical protein